MTTRASRGVTEGTMDLTVAVVSYNTRDLVLDCLESLCGTAGSERREVILVDNDSRDGTVAAVRTRYPNVLVIANSENEGFAKAVNQALAVGRGRYFLMLNSDTRVTGEALDLMAACLDAEEGVGAVSCRQWTEDGRMYQSCFPFPSIFDHLCHASVFRRLAPRLHARATAARAIDCARTQDVDWANGACLMVRASLLKECGGLDETFFMYFEDVDLCRRIRARGYRVRHLAEAGIMHLVGRSSHAHRDRLSLAWEFGRIRYVEKHCSVLERWIMKLWIALGALSRGLTGGSSGASGGRSCRAIMGLLWRGTSGKRWAGDAVRG